MISDDEAEGLKVEYRYHYDSVNSIPDVESYTEKGEYHDQWESVRKRCFLLAAMVSFFALCGGSAYLPAMPDAQASLGASDFEISMTLIGPNIVLAFGPLFVGPLSDRFGRRLLYVLLIGYIGSLLICAASLGIWMLVIGRTMSYVFCCGFTSIATAIIAEIYPPAKRATAIGTLMLPSFLGSILIPPISGVAVQFFGWRSAYWIIAIPAMIGFFLVFFFLPETVNYSTKKRSLNPVSTIAIIFKYPLLGLIFCNGFTFVAMLMMSANFSIIISQYYPYGAALIGLMYMPYGIGCLLGAFAGGRIADRMKKEFGIGGLALTHVIFATITGFSVLLFGWSVRSFPVVAVCALLLASFGGISSRSTIVATGVHFNPTAAAATTAALVCFQFLLSVPELAITGFLLDKLYPGPIFTVWAGLIFLFMPFSLIVTFQYWNKQTK